MEVEIKNHFPDMQICTIAAPVPLKNIPGSVHGYLDICLINHRADRGERIIGCWAEIRVTRYFLWKRTLATIPAGIPMPNMPHDALIDDIFLEPMGSPKKFTIRIMGNIDKNVKLPNYSELVIVFRMVGPIRKYLKTITKVRNISSNSSS